MRYALVFQLSVQPLAADAKSLAPGRRINSSFVRSSIMRTEHLLVLVQELALPYNEVHLAAARATSQ